MKRMAAGELARQARADECSPRTAHEKNIEAERLAVEAEDLSDHAQGNEELMQNINPLLHYLAVSKHQSRYRRLAITAMEEAICWLHRENGDAEPERKFEAVEAPGKINGKVKA
jgi:uncharacterized protein (DUF2225 family)